MQQAVDQVLPIGVGEIYMDEKKSFLTIESRKKLSLNGVVEVISFNEKLIILNTSFGVLTIKGENLKMTKLDVQNGDVIMTGVINSLGYAGSEQKNNNDSIIARLFK